MNSEATPMRSAFMRLLQGQPAGNTVWTADITYWMAGQAYRGRADPAWDTEDGYLRLHRSVGIMPFYYYPKFSAGQPTYDASVSETWEKQGSITRHQLTTPIGELVEETTEMVESSCSGCTRHFIHTQKDLDVLLYLLEHRTLVPVNLDDYPTRLAAWEAFDGLPALGLPRSPFASFCYEWAGIENATYLLMDNDVQVRRILALMEKQEKPLLDAICRLAPPLIHFPDNLDSENLTSFYDEFLGPTHRRRMERLHASGIRTAVHLDGAVRGLLPKLAAAGFDAVEALTPKPAGDLDIAEMRALAGSSRLILWGGIPGAMFAPPYTWDDMRRHLDRVLECWHGQPFILGVADQVPPDGDISFCRKIAEVIA